MKYALCIIALFAGLALTGCRDAKITSVESETHDVAPEYSEKKGLLLPEVTRKAIDLKIVEVGEEAVNSTFTLQLRVYEQVNGTVHATGLVVPERATRLKTGQIMEVRGRDDTTWTGSVIAVNDHLQKVTGQVEVLVEIPEVDSKVSMGTLLSGSFPVHSQKGVVTIPRGALLKCSEGEFVYAVNGEHFVRTAVKVGAMNSEWVEITDGLYSGDQVVATPVMALWLTELAAVKGGQACCITPPKGK